MKFYDYDTYIANLSPIYKELERSISELLPLARIEHVGASSVEGCISKGDLDVLVAVEQSQFEESMNQIKTLSFYEKKDTLRTDDLCMLVTNKYEGEDVAIQLIANGSSFENFIKFRNILRSCPAILEQYNDLKKMSEGLDENRYIKKKSNFVTSILKLTEFPNQLASKVLNISEDSLNPERTYDDDCCALWINPIEVNRSSNRIKLISVSENNLWDEMFKIRKSIELSEFGIDDDVRIENMIDKVKSYTLELNGEWFLAQLGEKYIGEIGLVPVFFDGDLYGRLQDVDILKSYRGHGYANDLVKELIYLSYNKGMKGLGVRANNDSWIKNWYQRLGFLPIEIWK